ncbi:helix-turn-helix domain-containing protein [Haloterrigena salinisoli]|uniref:helix-turn-helix domain-containing protein n=1 Tax=Haloterrigena salinisoli TaxID=3132747 RepID=UPI0030D2A463
MSLEFSSSGDSPDLEGVAAVLDDADCREIIALLEAPKTVPEIAEAVDLPLSTTYRKLDRLTDAGLASETVGVREGRHHTSRYVASFDRIGISLDDEHEFRVDIGCSNDQSLGIWSNAREEF